MAGQEVRATNVAESRGNRRTAFRTSRCHGLLIALRALFAFMPIAGMHLVAQASEIELATADASATDEAPAARGAALIEPASYRASHDAPPACEQTALEPQDSEHDVGLGARATDLPRSHAPLLPFTVHVVHGAPAMWVAQFSISSALPRGPPESRRSVDTPTSRAGC